METSETGWGSEAWNDAWREERNVYFDYDADNYFGYFAISEDENGNSEMQSLRSSRFLSNKRLLVSLAVLTQIIVVAVTAVIMGVAVLTMCALLGELLVIAAVAAALERQVVSIVDLTTFMEVSVTVIITVVTIFLAAVSSGGKIAESGITISRFS